MATLSAMFSHIPPATLTAALRAHKWHMENTVAYLLDDSSRDYATASSADADADAPQQPPAAAPPRRYQGRGKPTTLPDDFLRVPGRPRSSSAATAASDDQLRADEALARQLQQQEAGLSRVDTRYQQHRRARSTSLQHAPSHHHSQHQRRPRVQSAPGYPPSADAGGRAPSPAEEGLEKLGKALGQVCTV